MLNRKKLKKNHLKTPSKKDELEEELVTLQEQEL